MFVSPLKTSSERWVASSPFSKWIFALVPIPINYQFHWRFHCYASRSVKSSQNQHTLYKIPTRRLHSICIQAPVQMAANIGPVLWIFNSHHCHWYDAAAAGWDTCIPFGRNCLSVRRVISNEFNCEWRYMMAHSPIVHRNTTPTHRPF